MKSVYLLYAAAGAALLVLLGIYEKWQTSQIFNGAPVGSTASAFNLPSSAFAAYPTIDVRAPGAVSYKQEISTDNGIYL